jgi:hypothetical protein
VQDKPSWHRLRHRGAVRPWPPDLNVRILLQVGADLGDEGRIAAGPVLPLPRDEVGNPAIGALGILLEGEADQFAGVRQGDGA